MGTCIYVGVFAMTYSIIGILAAIILFIINRDVFWVSDNKKLAMTQRHYRRFLLGVLAYYITDFFGGSWKQTS